MPRTLLSRPSAPLAPLALLLSLAAAPACDGCSNDAPLAAPTAAAAVVALAPVPVPAGLLAEIVVPSPEATWGKARIIMGGGAMFLPKGIGALMANFLGLPITSAPEIDGEVPMLGAVVEVPGQKRPLAAFGLHVKAGGRLVEHLSVGQGARFKARVDPDTGITLLTPAEGRASTALGVLGNYLLIADHEPALLAVGPYVARTMPKTPATKDDAQIMVPASALSGPAAAWMQNAWRSLGEAELQGVPSSEEVATSLLGVGGAMESMIGVLGDLEGATLSLNLAGDAAHLVMTMKPKAGAGPATAALSALSFGDPGPVLALPRDALVALMLRSSPGSRKEDAAGRADALSKLLGEGGAKLDRGAVAKAMELLGEARGDAAAVGVGLGPLGPMGYVRAPVADAGKLEAALGALWKVTQTAPVKARLGEAKVGLTRSKTVLENMKGDVDQWRIGKKDALEAAKKPGAPSVASDEPPAAVDVLFAVRGDELFVATGYDARAALRRVIEVPAAETLGGIEAMSAAVAALGTDVAFAVVAQPLAFLARRSGKQGVVEDAPVTFAITRSAGGGAGSFVARLDIANAAIRELAKGLSPL